jgi:hypothetical protein
MNYPPPSGAVPLPTKKSTKPLLETAKCGLPVSHMLQQEGMSNGMQACHFHERMSHVVSTGSLRTMGSAMGLLARGGCARSKGGTVPRHDQRSHLEHPRTIPV